MGGALEGNQAGLADMRNKRQRGPEWWWAAEPPERHAFFRALANWVDCLADGQILEVRFSGKGFQPTLRWAPEQARPKDSSHGEGSRAQRMGPEGWWAGLPPEGRRFYMGVSKILDEVAKGHSYMEVNRDGADLRACLVIRLNLPVGRAELN